MREGTALQVIGIAIIVISLGWCVAHPPLRSGGDLATVDSPSSELPVAVERSVPADDTPAEVAARLQPEVSRQGVETPDNAMGSSPRSSTLGDRPAGRDLPVELLAEYEDTFLPTEAGLYDMTIGVWDNPDFLELTQDEASELLGLDDTMGLKGPETLFSIAGPLPTEDDARVGFRSTRVQRALEIVCFWDIAIVECPKEKVAMRPGLIALRDQAMTALMEMLDEETGFKNWTLWHRLYVRWSRGE